MPRRLPRAAGTRKQVVSDPIVAKSVTPCSVDIADMRKLQHTQRHYKEIRAEIEEDENLFDSLRSARSSAMLLKLIARKEEMEKWLKDQRRHRSAALRDARPPTEKEQERDLWLRKIEKAREQSRKAELKVLQKKQEIIEERRRRRQEEKEKEKLAAASAPEKKPKKKKKKGGSSVASSIASERDDESTRDEGEAPLEDEDYPLYEPETVDTLLKSEKIYWDEYTLQKNHVRANLEFQFSDAGLKRDKRFSQRVVDTYPKGYLPLDDLLNEYIKSLVSRGKYADKAKSLVLEAIGESKVLSILPLRETDLVVGDGELGVEGKIAFTSARVAEFERDPNVCLYVGRPGYVPPKEQDWPFRRTVFAFNIPASTTKDDIIETFKPFGEVKRIEFDSGPDSTQREIQSRLMEDPRVFKLFYKRRARDGDDVVPEDLKSPKVPLYPMTFACKPTAADDDTFQCKSCDKLKKYNDSYYHCTTAAEGAILWCPQCAAKEAEAQANEYNEKRDLGEFPDKELYLGRAPRLMDDCKTACVVFASQRQASKCVYVRSRFATHEADGTAAGVFVTHFHNFQKYYKDVLEGTTS